MDLGTEFTRAKEVVRASFVAASEITSIGQFVLGWKELLVLGDRPGERAMERYGKKWNALGRDKNGRADGTGPAGAVIAGRAVAVIVNPANKLTSLTLRQVETIYRGDVDDWTIIGGTGLAASGGKSGGKSGDIRIHSFGLYARDPATKIFGAECLPRWKWRRVTVKKNTAEVVAAVGVDPQAIAFVDWAAIPAAGQNVKVLAIKVGFGAKAKVIKPTAANIKNAMYPLSGRLIMYVHPKAGATAKRFAKFIATCGGSVAGPYADTVKAVMAAYQKRGLIPLADAAIQRGAKDALAKAKADASKGKRKRR